MKAPWPLVTVARTASLSGDWPTADKTAGDTVVDLALRSTAGTGRNAENEAGAAGQLGGALKASVVEGRTDEQEAEHLAIVVANRRVAHRQELRGFCIGPHVGGGYALRDGGLDRRVTRREIFAATEVGAVAAERDAVGVDDRHESRRHLIEDRVG